MSCILFSGAGKGTRMSETSENGAGGSATSFDALYRPLLRTAVGEIVAKELTEGADAGERAQAYAERGKPDFALAWLLVADLSDDEKRTLYAQAHERRAAY